MEHAKTTAQQPVPSSQQAATPPLPPLSPKVLNNLLPTPDKVAQILGAADLVVFKSVDTLIDESPVIDNNKLHRSFAPAQDLVYRNAGWTAARVQAVHEPGPVPISFEILQAAVEFPSEAAAQKGVVRPECSVGGVCRN